MTKKEKGCSSCDEQNKKVAGKITAEQLTTIKTQQEEIAQALRDIGFLETQKHGLLHKYAGTVQDAEKFKEELEKEYGGININLEDGSYTLIEEAKKSE